MSEQHDQTPAAEQQLPSLSEATSSSPVVVSRFTSTKALFSIAGALIFVTGLIAIIVAVSGTSTFPMQGSLILQDPTGFSAVGAKSCAGDGGYRDLATGAAVTIYSPAGEIIATDSVDTATVSANGQLCVFEFRVDVPKGYDFYSVEVSHRGKVTLTDEDAEGFGALLTIGG